jgi:hypothetical protein
MPDQAFYDDLPRRLRIVAEYGWVLHDFPCPHGCYFHDEAIGQPCCQGMCCKGKGDTPEARAARKLADAIEKRLAERKVRIGMDRATGHPVIEGLTAEEARIGSDNFILYLSEHGTAATRAAIQRAKEMSHTARVTTSTDRTARVIER